MMTRKHYRMIAETIRDQYRIAPVDAHSVLYDLAHDLARKLKADNPNFRMETFFAACFE